MSVGETFMLTSSFMQTWRASPDTLLIKMKGGEGMIIDDSSGSETTGKIFLLKCLSSTSRQYLDALQRVTNGQQKPQVMHVTPDDRCSGAWHCKAGTLFEQETTFYPVHAQMKF